MGRRKILPKSGTIVFNKEQKSNPALILLPALMIAKIIIWIGETVIFGAKVLVFPFLLVAKIRTPHFKQSRKRGRPRTQPFLTFYRRKTVRLIDRFIPKPARLTLVVLVISLVVFVYSLSLISLAKSLPSPTQLTWDQAPLTTEIYDRHNRLLYRFYDGKNRQLIKLSDLPQDLINATVASEDKNFWNHRGVDLFGIIRAIKYDFYTHNESLQGGSTITQQLIKNTLLTPDQTLQRKLKEVLLAFWTEQIFDKRTVLQMYFNRVPYGGPAWGVAAASQMYFNKTPKELNLAEAAYLAGLPVAPTQFSPFGAHPEQGKLRQSQVLARMVEEHFITPTQQDQALKTELNFARPMQDIKAAHFVMFTRAYLASKYGEAVVSHGGLKVITSLDLDLQEMAEKVVLSNVEKLHNLQVGNGAAMVTEVKTGHILAMVGSKRYDDPEAGNYNVTLALRQPGSSIKPVTYAAAFKQGMSPGTVIVDAPTNFPDGTNRNYSPVNYDGTFHGAVSIRSALANSYNVPAVKVLTTIGIPSMVETARDMGITTFDHPESYGLSLTLGGAAVRLADMMSVYGTLAAAGVKHNISPILLVTDAKGKVLEDNEQGDAGKRVLTSEVAYLISHILSDNTAREKAFGKKSLLEIPGFSVAVKTGTADEKTDNWTLGYTPEFVVGVWVGNTDNSRMNPSLASGITGAAPIWHEIFANLLEGRNNLSFERPSGIIEATVDGNHDLAISGQVPKTVTAYQRQVEGEVVVYTPSTKTSESKKPDTDQP